MYSSVNIFQKVSLICTCRYVHDAQSFPIENDERQVSFIVNDGIFNSSTAIACIQLVDANDDPLLTLGTDASVDVMLLYSEGQMDPLVLAPELQIIGDHIVMHKN